MNRETRKKAILSGLFTIAAIQSVPPDQGIGVTAAFVAFSVAIPWLVKSVSEQSTIVYPKWLANLA